MKRDTSSELPTRSARALGHPHHRGKGVVCDSRANLDTLSSRVDCRPYRASLLAFRESHSVSQGYVSLYFFPVTSNATLSRLWAVRHRILGDVASSFLERERGQRTGSRWSLIEKESVPLALLSSRIAIIVISKRTYDTWTSSRRLDESRFFVLCLSPMFTVAASFLFALVSRETLLVVLAPYLFDRYVLRFLDRTSCTRESLRFSFVRAPRVLLNFSSCFRSYNIQIVEEDRHSRRRSYPTKCHFQSV